MPSATRGPLPASVYWRRRAVVATSAMILVFALGKMLSGGSDGADAETASGGTAMQAGAPADASPSSKPSAKPKKNKGKSKPSATPTPTPTPLAQPSGPCEASEVLITPTVPTPIAGGPVAIVLNLQTSTTEACTWRVSPETVTLKITSGPDDVWTSRECPSAVPAREVVVRRTVATQVPVTWSSRRSDEYCTERTAWALPGEYRVAAAALGGEPTDVAFNLVAPTPAVVTQTAEPEPKPAKGKGNRR